jgi:5-methylcytosine-specific restriction endonuclease McrA
MVFCKLGLWHVDHVIPLSSAKSKEEELEKLYHYTNLQPLWAIENIRKGSRLQDNLNGSTPFKDKV